MKCVAFLAALTLLAGSGSGATALKCPDLLGTGFDSEVRIESATLMPATAKTPEHCDVRGIIWPENQFALKLPEAWNKRFYMVGNGGTAGVISLAPMDNGLRLGYAAASTNTGHDAAKEPLGTFARRGPDNPHAERKNLGFSYLAVHETAVLAKKIIKAYYGDAARYSYWVGCSTGGRQGFSEAQRYPEDFDGLVIGAPVINVTGSILRMFWNQQASNGPGRIPADKLPLLAKAVYTKCDKIDGLEDGLIDDPRMCKVDPNRDFPKCTTGEDSLSCFTPAQVEALTRIYGGAKSSAGKQLFPGQIPGAEILAPSGQASALKSGWDGFIVGAELSALPRWESYLKYVLLDPTPGPEWNYRSFNFDTDPDRIAKNAHKINSTNPDLSALQRRGGKIVHYHGWADTAVIPQNSISYYESVLEKMGSKETRDFYKLYMVPGMFHCGGGVGCSTVDWLSPLVDWVEKGVAPEALIGSRVEGGEAKRTRPICPYPQVARYKGAGSVDEAASFTCASPR